MINLLCNAVCKTFPQTNDLVETNIILAIIGMVGLFSSALSGSVPTVSPPSIMHQGRTIS